MRGWRLQLAIFGAALASLGANLALGGYQVDFPVNHSHQLPVVLHAWDPEPFANDPFVRAPLGAPHLFWSLVALVLRPSTLDAGLLAFFVAFKLLFFFSAGSLAAGLARRRPLWAALAAMVLFVDGPPPIFGGSVLNWTYPTHTQAARALALAAMAAAAWRLWWLGSAALALAGLAHPMLGAFGGALWVAACLADPPAKARDWAARLLLPALGAIPAALAVRGRSGGAIPPGWADWIAENYAIHHAPHRQPMIDTLFPALVCLGLLAASGTLRRRGRALACGWMAACWAVIVAGYAGCVWLRHPLFLQLQPFRMPALAIPVAGAALAACVASARAPMARKGRTPSPILPWALLLLWAHFETDWLPMVWVAAMAVACHGAGLVASSRGSGFSRRLRAAWLAASASWPAWMALSVYALLMVERWIVPASWPATDAGAMALGPTGAMALSLGLALASGFWTLGRARERTVLVSSALAVAGLWALQAGVPAALAPDKSFYRRAARPEMRDLGDWIQANLPKDVLLAAPEISEDLGGKPLRGLRVAAWRSLVWDAMDSAGVYYDPSFMRESDRRRAALGPEASEAFLFGRSSAWLDEAVRLGATHLVLPSAARPALPGWRPIYNNGAYRVLERAEE